MTKTFEVVFRLQSSPTGTVSYRIKVTDKMEDRDAWKRVEAINRACEKFNSEHRTGWTGSRYLIRSKTREVTAQTKGDKANEETGRP